MKVLFLVLTLFLARAEAEKSIYDFEMKNIDGKNVSLTDYKGKVLLIVNTASKCGYTKQYDPLEKLYLKYKDKGLVVLAFPSNDFLSQEPGSDQEIKKFCQTRFNVTFPLFSKITVKGNEKSPLYVWLTEQAPQKGEIGWNFEKFLVDRGGRIKARYPSKVEPQDPQLVQALEKEL